jgi:DNA-binding transcriptional ArsR family regulator
MLDLDHVFDAAAGYFALLSEPMRLRILHAVCEGERTVGDIVRATGSSQTNVSRHLNVMFRAGALKRRRDRNFTWYSVADPTLTELCRTVCVHLVARDQLESTSHAFALAAVDSDRQASSVAEMEAR